MELDLKVIKRFFRGFYNVIIFFVILATVFFGMSYFSHLKSTDQYVTAFQEELIRLIEVDIKALQASEEPPDSFFLKYNTLHLELISNILVVKPNGDAFFTTNVDKKYSYHGIGNKGAVQLDKLVFKDNIITTKRLDNNYEILVLTAHAMIRKMVFADWIAESRLQFSLSVLIPIIILVLLMLIEDKLIKDLETKFQYYFTAFEDKNQEKEELYRGLYYHNRCVMLLIDPVSGYVVEGNEAAVAYYGYEFRNQQIKISEINTMPPEELQKIIEDALGKRRNYFNFQHRLANGMVRDVEVYSGPVVMGGKPLLCSIVHDVTDKIRAEQNLLNQQLEMERKIQEKSEVLATISHEIKTPIAGIIHNINDLTEKIVDEGIQKQLQFLMLNVNSLNRLVFDLLDYSRIDAGGFKFYSTQFDMIEVLNSSVALFHPVAVEKDIQITLNTENLQQTRFVGDAFRIGQIVNNLISNSVKYTHDGCIDITVSDEKMGHQSLVTIVVEDTGIGMKPEVVDQIFKRFYTTDTSGKLGGTGLGLAICGMIVEAMSGTLEVTSEEGVGTAMTLVLELDNDQGADISLLNRSPARNLVLNQNVVQTNAGVHILIVDDDPMSLLFVEKMLRQLSTTDTVIDLAYNGQEAISHAENRAYQFVFVDNQLPDIEGYMLIQQLKQLNEGSMGTVLISAEPVDVQSMAVDAFLLKPVDYQSLSHLMSRFFPNRIEVTVQSEALTLSDKKYLDNEALENLLDYMSQDELISMLEVFESAVHEKFDRLPKQLEMSDLQEVLKVFHTLKGSTSYLRAERFLALLLEIETALRDQSDLQMIQTAYGAFMVEFAVFIDEVSHLKRYVESHYEQLF